MSPAPAKLFCIHCAHHSVQVHDHVCLRTETDVTNLVTGEKIHLLPKPCAYERSLSGECGAAGLFWTPKSPA